MWFGIFATIIITILIFSAGTNKKMPWHNKEDKNVINDPGSDGDD